MAIVISIHQVADKSVTWKQAAQATQFGAIWLQLIGQEVWQKLSYLFDQLPRLHKSLGNPTDLVCSRNDYILWYKFQKFKKCKTVLGYALIFATIEHQVIQCPKKGSFFFPCLFVSVITMLLGIFTTDFIIVFHITLNSTIINVCIAIGIAHC